MAELVLVASDDLVARLAREGDPVRAVVELVWNAVDGEAHVVAVRLERQPDLGGIIAVSVEDDGHGISADEVQATFGRSSAGASPKPRRGRVRIIEWRSGKHRALYFGVDEQHFVYEEPGRDIEGQYPYSAYVTWEGLTTDRVAVLGLGDMAPEPVSDLRDAVRDAIRTHFATRRSERRREQVQDWKEAGVYPYEGEPVSEPEQAERIVFDVVSSALAPQLARSSRAGTRLTLTLLRDAIQNDPDNLATILQEVVALSGEDRQSLARLLSETTLSAIIRSANLIVSRQKFLTSLEHIIFDPDDSPAVRERDHLHKILERELWVFGEGYRLMNSERSLTELLRTHLRMEGLPDKDAQTVRRWDGRSGRVDLHLAVRFQEHDRIRHLIVELKAPSVTVGRKELDQVEDYAYAFLSTPQFAGSSSHWDLILVAGDYDDMVRTRMRTQGGDFETGKFWAPSTEGGEPRVTAYVRRWRDIIDENHRRIEYLTKLIHHDPSIADSLSYLRDKHADLLPPTLVN